MKKTAKAKRDDPEQRSRTMRAVRSRDTKPELVVRRFLHAAGLRYRLYDQRLPGKPDLVFPRRRVALFVHGCFWHQHLGCPAATRPKSHSQYWNTKLDNNAARDARTAAALNDAGWHALVIWECETHDQQRLERLARQIRGYPQQKRGATRVPHSNFPYRHSGDTITKNKLLQ